MNDWRKTVGLAIEALEVTEATAYNIPITLVRNALTALREALVQPDNADPYRLVYELAARSNTTPKQEPVAWMCSNEELVRKGYEKFSPSKLGDWNIPVYANHTPIIDQEPKLSIPEGWQLVPKTPTEEMIAATKIGPVNYPGFCYKAMLSAAPKLEDI